MQAIGSSTEVMAGHPFCGLRHPNTAGQGLRLAGRDQFRPSRGLRHGFGRRPSQRGDRPAGINRSCLRQL